MSLKVKFLGAVGTVTGSCTLLHYERTDTYFLVDCGLFQGFPGFEERNQRKFGFDPKQISAVLLTHAHIDHCGLLPRLVKEGFQGRVICTQATKEFSLTALGDAVKLTGLYDHGHVQQLEQLFDCPDEKEDFQFGRYYPLDTDLFFSFLRSAHIVGAVAVEFRFNVSSAKNITITFSGDIGPCADGASHGGLQKARQYPNPNTEYIVCESTYGGRPREAATGRFENRIQALGEVLREALSLGPRAVVIFPAYTLQRTQELVAELHYVLCRQAECSNGDGGMAHPTVIIDSPMAKLHTETMHTELRRVNSKAKRLFLNDKSPLFQGLGPDEVDAMLANWFAPEFSNQDGRWSVIYGNVDLESLPGPAILVTSSGNCLGGPVLKHLSQHLTNHQATVVLTGYQPAGGPGDLLKEMSPMPREDRERIKLKLGEVEIRGDAVEASVKDLSSYYSGHADEDGLVNFILHDDTGKATHPLAVFLNHGDGRARELLKLRLEATAQSGEPGWRKLGKVFTPDSGKGWFHLEKGEWLPDAEKPASSEQTEEMLLLLREIAANQREIIALLRQGRTTNATIMPSVPGITQYEE